MEPSYRVATGKIAHQNIDGEIIVIHFDTGDYYSLTGTAAALWEMMAAAPHGVASMRARFAGWDATAEAAVTKFLDVLVREGLIHSVDEAAAAAFDGPALPFQEPALEKYTDMKTILLADPIHDAEEEGWPKVKAQG
jgi:hypothetical protein